jgi:predicted nucleic acid-binding protein
MRYFDASALAKYYIEEAETAFVRRLLESPGATSRLSSVEVSSAIIRRAREARTPAERRDRALHALGRDMAGLMVVELTPEVVTGANGILTRHTLRAADAIHIASCVSLCDEFGTDIPFVVFDERLREAALAEGLTVEP